MNPDEIAKNVVSGTARVLCLLTVPFMLIGLIAGSAVDAFKCGWCAGELSWMTSKKKKEYLDEAIKSL